MSTSFYKLPREDIPANRNSDISNVSKIAITENVSSVIPDERNERLDKIISLLEEISLSLKKQNKMMKKFMYNNNETGCEQGEPVSITGFFK